MEKTNRRIVISLAVFLGLFVFLLLYMTYFQQVKAEEIADNEYNRRLWIDENQIRRGTIYDRDLQVLVETRKDQEGNNYRAFLNGLPFANITGYNSKVYGTSGLEKAYGKVLLNINEKTPLSELKDLVATSDLGNSLQLTVNSRLQEKAYDVLEGHKGAVVVLNPRTGEVYAMSSRPSFNPNTTTADWEELVNNENSPLINRATQGQYTPGSIWKIITASALLESDSVLDLTYRDDTGQVTINGYTISNYGQEAYGKTDLKKALVQSSNVYFAKLGTDLGQDKLQDMAYRYQIGETLAFDLPTTKSVDGFAAAKDQAELATAAFGQGASLVSPLNMALMMATVANGGRMMQPYLVSQIIDPDGDIKTTTQPQVLAQPITEDQAAVLLADLKATADGYSRLGLRGINIAAKSGTAEIKNKESTHSWMVAAAPAENPRFVVALVLEDDGGSGQVTAAPLANQILAECFQRLPAGD